MDIDRNMNTDKEMEMQHEQKQEHTVICIDKYKNFSYNYVFFSLVTSLIKMHVLFDTRTYLVVS